MQAVFDRFEIQMSLKEAKSASHPGPCDEDVDALLKLPKIAKQLDKIGHDRIRDELREYGAWDEEELANWEDCKARIVWIAAGNICEEVFEKYNR